MLRQGSKTRHHLSLTFWSAILLMFGAGAAGASLWRLHYLQSRAVHISATRTALDQGESLTAFLASLPDWSSTNISASQWRLFNTLVAGLHAAQNDLQFVSVTRDGETLFHRQTSGLAAPPLPDAPTLPENAPVSVSSVNLELGGRSLPVMVFRREIIQRNGNKVVIELGLQRSVVEEAEKNAVQAIRALFRLSALTVAMSFGLCLLLLIWVVRRDRRRETQARQEEHLAFSGALANGIVHDFRNPMSSVRLDAQMLERELARSDGARQARVSELAGRIGRTINRMDRVFEEFLYLARPAAETLESVDMAACMNECMETLAPRFEQANLKISRLWSSPAPRATAAPFALRRALINILLNAIQFSPRGGEIEIDIRMIGGRVVVDVMDRGPGIAPRDRQRVFEMFVSGRPEGTGLGLFLARTAIRKCGGEIEALGRAGGGVQMRMILNSAGEGARRAADSDGQTSDSSTGQSI